MKRPAKRYWSPERGKGEAVRWLRENVSYAGGNCLAWPFASHPTGYGTFGYLGKMFYAHRFMCELTNGPAPSPKHYASHNCGNGHLGCVHPQHLAWKTSQENAIDRLRHGNNWQKGQRPKYLKLNRQKADQIRAMKGQKTQRQLAEEYGVSRETVSHIHCGRMWPAVVSS
jgi:hypothetical protein